MRSTSAGDLVRAPEQLAQQPLAVGQAVGGDIVGAVVEPEGGGVEFVKGVEDVGGVEAGDALAGWAEEEGRVADDIGLDDQLKAGAFGDDDGA
jgi:hypothetical protein